MTNGPKNGRGCDWITTSRGESFWPLDPRPADFHLLDVAHSLANLCRFTGHVREFYSVAQHSVLVASAVRPELRRAALLHDAAEAYIGDIARPTKRLMKVDGMTIHEIEARILGVAFESFGVPWPSLPGWAEIYRADNVLLATEFRDLMRGTAPEWLLAITPLADCIVSLGPAAARECYAAALGEAGLL